MPSALRQLAFAVCLAVMATVVSAIAVAQRQADLASKPKGIFSSINQDLSEAADRSLATVLSNQAWMNSPPASTPLGDFRCHPKRTRL